MTPYTSVGFIAGPTQKLENSHTSSMYTYTYVPVVGSGCVQVTAWVLKAEQDVSEVVNVHVAHESSIIKK